MLPEDHQRQQEENRRFNNGSNAGCVARPCRKSKQKKPPQRGLGVAQLEKIRLEEELQKKEAQGGSSSFLLPLPCNLTSPNSHFKQGIPIPNFDLFNPTTLPAPPPLAPPYAPHDITPPLWNRFNYSDRDAFRPPPRSDPVWLGPCVLQRKQLPQQISPLVNVSSSPSSSGVDLQMEPPSNQSYCSNLTASWPEQERMVGMKRPWHFFLDHPPRVPASIPCKLATIPPLFQRWDEPPSGLDAFKFYHGTTSIREGPGPSSSSSRILIDDSNPGKQHGAMDGRFLTLAPPAIPDNLKFKQPRSTPACTYGDLDLLPHQASEEDVTFQVGSLPTAVTPQEPPPPFYSFLPRAHASTTETSSDGRGGGEAESVDLNLKL